MLFKDVPMRTRRALSLYKVYDDSAFLMHVVQPCNPNTLLKACMYVYKPFTENLNKDTHQLKNKLLCISLGNNWNQLEL